tara:strand:+ start:1970 stop:2149 length:180 start_codon:yes stop_codon:yes gene_type:complete
MKSEIINYLTVQLMEDKSFEAHYAKRIRCAWILAEKKYLTLTHQEKQGILRKLEEEKQR